MQCFFPGQFIANDVVAIDRNMPWWYIYLEEKEKEMNCDVNTILALNKMTIATSKICSNKLRDAKFGRNSADDVKKNQAETPFLR